MEALQNKVKQNLIHFFLRDFHFPITIFPHPYDRVDDYCRNYTRYDTMSNDLRTYMWFIRDIMFEGDLGAHTLDCFLKVFFTHPDITNDNFQIIVRDYFLNVLYRLEKDGYFEPEDEHTPEILRHVFRTYIINRMEYLLNHYQNNALLLEELKTSFQTCFDIFFYLSSTFHTNIIEKRLKSPMNIYYSNRQQHLNQLFHPHRPVNMILMQFPFNDFYQRLTEFTFGFKVSESEIVAYVNTLRIEYVE